MKFKEGDTIIQLYDCCDNYAGKEYILKYVDGILKAYSSYHNSCSCHNKWLKKDGLLEINRKSYLKMLGLQYN